MHPVLDAVVTPILVFEDQTLLYVNPTAQILLGYSLSQLIEGRFVLPSDCEKVELNAAYGKISVAISYNDTELAGRKIRVFTLQPIIPSQHIDWFKSRVMERIVETIPDAIYVYDLNERRNIYINRAITDLLGFSSEEVIAMGEDMVETIIHLEDYDAYLEDQQRFIQLKDDQVYETTYRWRNAFWEWSYLHTRNMVFNRNLDGSPRQIIGLVSDITQSKKLEQALMERTHNYHELASNIPGMVYRARFETVDEPTFDYLSPRCFELNGVAPEVIQQNPEAFLNLIHPEDLDTYKRARRRSLATLEPFRWVGRMVINGQIKWRRMEATAHQLPDTTIIWDGIEIDITEQREAEIALRESEQRYRLLADNTHDMVALQNLEGRYIYVSPSFEKVLGYTPDELLRFHQTMLIHPSDLEIVQHWLHDAIRGAKLPTHIMFRARKKIGDYLWLESSVSPIYDERQQLTQLLISSRDITERIQVEQALLERKRLEVELQKELEMSEIKSKMMARISHEFRTPLAIIANATNFLDRYMERLPTEKRTDQIAKIHYQIGHLTEMLSDIARVVQGSTAPLEFNPKLTNFHQLCSQIIDDLQTWKIERTIVCLIPEPLYHLVIDSKLIERILTNLLTNALKYSQSIVRLEVFQQQDRVVLRVSDEGIGISDEDLQNIFKPFYRGVNSGEIGGLGLGLAIVKDAVDLHNGVLEIESHIGSGTQVTVRLPILKETIGVKILP